jgi:IclR family KDG regulon transcriptional repressor
LVAFSIMGFWRKISVSEKKKITKSTNRYEVTSAARGLDVLEALAHRGRPMTVSEVAAAVELPRPTVFRLLATLLERNWIYKEATYYRLGFKCFQLGAVAGAGLEIRTHALPHLVQLRDETNLNVQIAKLETWHVVYLERVLTQNLTQDTPSRAGAILPSHCTALGKALLAHKNMENVAAWAEREGLEEFTPTTIVTIPDLVSELLRIRARGYSTEQGEREIGISCIAAPVIDFTGEVVAALSVSGTPERMPTELVGSDLALRILKAARDVSTALGAPKR